jgi:hypothetical protein
MDYQKLAPGITAISGDTKKADGRLPGGMSILPTTLFVTERSQVEVVIRINGKEHVNFSDTVDPGPVGGASIYVRTLIRPNMRADAIPNDPAIMEANRVAEHGDGLPPEEPTNG